MSEKTIAALRREANRYRAEADEMEAKAARCREEADRIEAIADAADKPSSSGDGATK